MAGRLNRLLLLAALYLLPPAVHGQEIRIGVLAFRGTETALNMWVPTADYLSRQIPGATFKIIPLDLAGMHARVRDRKLDFVLTNTGNYVELEARFGISRIATLKNLRQGGAYTEFGAVIFTRMGHPEISALADLKGHSFMAVSRDAFGGFQMAWRELLRHGIDPFADFKQLRFAGFPQDEIVYAVQRGDVDAGTVRTDTLERMAREGKVSLESFKVLNQKSAPRFSFLLSTDLYPEWPFAKLRHTSELLSEQVAVALLSLPATSEAARAAQSAGWTIPLDYGSVHELFRHLRIGPYAHLNRLTWKRVWQEYGSWIVAALIVVCVMIVFLVWLIRVNRRIALEVTERKEAQRTLAAHSDTLEQRVTERTRKLEELNLALQKRDFILRQLHEIAARSGSRFEEKLRKLLQAGCEHYGLSHGVLAEIYDRNCHILHLNAPSALFTIGDIVSVNETILCLALQRNETLCISDVSRSEFRDKPIFNTNRICSIIGTPLYVDGTIFGTLNFCDVDIRGEPFTSVDVDILLLIAQWIGGEIGRYRAAERLQTHQHQLAHVARVNTMGEMASGIAHELNQPLTAILNYSRGGLRRLSKGGGPEEMASGFSKISSEAERAAHIIRQLREFLRPGELQHEAVDVHHVALSVARLAKPQLGQHDVEIIVGDAANFPRVSADRIQFEQVLLNLVLNAIDAVKTLDRKRIIKVEFEVVDQVRMRIIVTDNGVGIAKQNLDKIFHPFFTTKPDGMGMGMSITRSIIEAHGGKITIQSTPGINTCVELTLPLWFGQQDESGFRKSVSAP